MSTNLAEFSIGHVVWQDVVFGMKNSVRKGQALYRPAALFEEHSNCYQAKEFNK